MSTITVVGAGIGRQFINGDPNWCEWQVSYEIDGRGLYHHTVSSRDAHDSQDAIEWAKLELGQPDRRQGAGLGPRLKACEQRVFRFFQGSRFFDLRQAAVSAGRARASR
jgi:hypothetical protein